MSELFKRLFFVTSICITVGSQLSGQNDITIDEAWKKFLENECDVLEIHINSNSPENLIRYYLMLAYKEYCAGNYPASQDFIEKANIVKQDNNFPISRIPKFREKKQELLLKLSEKLKKAGEGRVNQNTTMRANEEVEKINGKIDDDLDEIARKLFDQFRESMPHSDSPIPCIQPTVEGEVVGLTGAKFTIKTVYCDTFISGYRNMNIAQLGMRKYYSAIGELLTRFVVKPNCIDLLNEQECIQSLKISIDIEGHADGFTINSPLYYNVAIGVPAGTNYTFRNSDGYDSSKLLSHNIDNQIRNNEELALARAWIAHDELKFLSDRVSLVAQTHNEYDKQGSYRKVIITVYADKLFEKIFLEEQKKMESYFNEILESIRELSID